MEQFYRVLNDKEKRDFLRMNPIWYKNFNRDINAYDDFNTTFETVKKEMKPKPIEVATKHLNTAQVILNLVRQFRG